MISLQLFGGLSIQAGGQPLAGPAAQRHRLALLALLIRARHGALSRDKLIATLWPERDAERARGLLNQAVHVLRRELGNDAVLSSGDDLRLNPTLVTCDVTEFEAAASSGDLERAVALYAGPFLDGFFLNDAPEFERWSDWERQSLAGVYGRVLEQLADRAAAEPNPRKAAEWWRARIALDPYDSAAVVRWLLALEALGNRAEALLQAEAHQRLLREDLGLESSPEVAALAERLRKAPAPAALAPSTVTPSFAPAPPTSPPARSEELQAQGGGGRSRNRALLLGLPTLLAIGIGVVLVTVAIRSGRPARVVAPSGTVDEIAQAVVRELARRQGGDTSRSSPALRTRSIPAYELYLRGSDPAVLRSDSAALLGLGYFRRAVALDSNYAAAWAGLARLTLRVARKDTTEPPDHYLARAEAAALRALHLDDSLAEAHAALGLIRVVQSDLKSGESHLRSAIALDPRVAVYREHLVKLYLWQERPAEALAEARKALELAPLSPSATAEVARALAGNGQCDEALPLLERLAALEPPLARVPGIMAFCHAQRGNWNEAIRTMRAASHAGSPASLGVLGWLLAKAGDTGEARNLLSRLQGAAGAATDWPIAQVHLGLGDIASAMPFLRRAVNDASLSPFTESAPLPAMILDAHRQDPRIAEFRRRLGLQNR